MNRLGNIALARLILEYRKGVYAYEYNYRRPCPELPEGWRRIGDGGSRYAYVGPDSLVYKVGYRGLTAANEKELDTFERIRAHGYPWVPLFALKAGVMIMPQYTPRSKLGRKLTREEEKTLREIQRVVYDATVPSNYGFRDDESMVLIDGGGGSTLLPKGSPKPKPKPKPVPKPNLKPATYVQDVTTTTGFNFGGIVTTANTWTWTGPVYGNDLRRGK